jgi:hypothetical protein
MTVAALAIPAVQYGIPAAIQLITMGANLIEKLNNDPNMTQEEFNALWQENVTRLQAANIRWENATGSAPVGVDPNT